MSKDFVEVIESSEQNQLHIHYYRQDMLTSTPTPILTPTPTPTPTPSIAKTSTTSITKTPTTRSLCSIEPINDIKEINNCRLCGQAFDSFIILSSLSYLYLIDQVRYCSSSIAHSMQLTKE